MNILAIFLASIMVLSVLPSIVNVLSIVRLNPSNSPSDRYIVDPFMLLSIPCLMVSNGLFLLPSPFISSPSVET